MQEDNNLREYFERRYYEGHFFERGDYEFLASEWCWQHKRTQIKVWADAIDLSLGRPCRVVFHYTDDLAFRRVITSAPADAWASLVQSGGSQGIYTVPKAPDEWQDREELLENNYRQMMRRDRDDPEKGSEYVAKAYPLKVAYCLPILVTQKAHDLCKEPEPKARKPPARRERKDLPPRQVVTFAMRDGQGALANASARLLETLRVRCRVASQKGPQHMEAILAKQRLCAVLLQQGLGQEAEPLLQELLDECSEHLEVSHPRTISALRLMAQASPEEAKKLLRRAAKAKKGADLEKWRAMQDLGVLLQRSSEFLEAEEMFKRVLRGREEALGSSHPETVEVLSVLTELLQEQGEVMEAEKLYCQAVNKSEEVLGGWHPWTANCMHQLGCLLQRRGKLFKAGERFRQALSVREEQLGLVHPDTLATVSCLGRVLQDQGKLAEAEDFFRRALQGREELGAVQALQAAEDLAQFFRAVGKLQKALSIVDDLGGRLQAMGKYKEVDALYKVAIKRSEEQLGATHPSTLSLLSRQAVLLQEQGKAVEAEFLQRQALRGREKVLGPSHPETLVSSSHLGYLLSLRQNFAEAEKLLSRALRGLEEVLDTSHVMTLVAVDHMGCLLKAQQRPEAEQLLKRALRGRQKQLGEAHQETITSMQRYAELLEQKERGQVEAEELWRRVVAAGRLSAISGLAQNLRRQQLPEATELVKSHAERLQEQGQLQEAEELLRRCHQESQAELGEGHHITLTYQWDLSKLLQARAQPAKELMSSAAQGFQRLGCPEAAEARATLALYMRRQAEMDAEQLLKTALEGLEDLESSVEEPQVVEVLANMAAAAGKHAVAEDLYQRLEGPDARRRMVLCLRAQGRLAEAEELCNSKEPLDLSLKAMILEDQEKMEEAESLHRQALLEREKQLCVSHPWALLCCSRLAQVLQARGKLEEAEELSRRALAGSEVEMGQGESLVYVNRLAQVLQARGKISEAEELHEKLMQDNTLTSLSNLGDLLHERGRLQEAEDVLRRVLREREEMQPLHLETLASKCALASVLRDAGDLEEAVELYKDALAGYEELDPFHASTLSTAQALANLRQGQGKLRKAEELYRRVWERRSDQLGARHLQTLQAARQLARNLRSQEKLKEAEELQSRVVETYEDQLGVSHLETLRATVELAELYEDSQELRKAEGLQRRVWEERSRVLGEGNAETLRSGYALAVLLENEDAEELLRVVLEGREKLLGPVHEEVVEVVGRLAQVLEALGDVAEAQKLYMRELQGREELFGAGHKKTQRSRQKLENFLRSIRESYPEDPEPEAPVSRTSSVSRSEVSEPSQVGQASRKVSLAPSLYQEALAEVSDQEDDAVDVAPSDEVASRKATWGTSAHHEEPEESSPEDDEDVRSDGVVPSKTMYQEALEPEDYETRSELSEEDMEDEAGDARSVVVAPSKTLYQEGLLEEAVSGDEANGQEAS